MTFPGAYFSKDNKKMQAKGLANVREAIKAEEDELKKLEKEIAASESVLAQIKAREDAVAAKARGLRPTPVVLGDGRNVALAAMGSRSTWKTIDPDFFERSGYERRILREMW